MKIIRKDQSKETARGDNCTSLDFPSIDQDIDYSQITLHGRYPDKNRILNSKCKELAYIIRGSGVLVIENVKIQLRKGDLVLIEPGEKYYWDGDLEMSVSCSPAWTSEQIRRVK